MSSLIVVIADSNDSRKAVAYDKAAIQKFNARNATGTSAPNMLKYCGQYGFDDNGIGQRLELLALSASDLAAGRRLHDTTIAPRLEQIVEAFYAEQLRHAAIRHYLDNPSLIASLKLTQKKYLMSLGLEFNQPAYFEERLRVGLAHARMRIPLNLYVCAYRTMAQTIEDALPDSVRRDPAELTQAVAFLRKITTLDMSLAIDTYHQSRVDDLESSLETLKEEENHLRHLAQTDPLTELANRAALEQALGGALASARRDKSRLCVLMADLDHFKQINDTHGHLVGDGVLREVAARLRSAVRDVDVVGRYGGEEFMVILAETPLETAREIAERIRARVAGTPIKMHSIAVGITISLGLAVLGFGDSVESLVERADQALYAAKSQGRDRVVVMDPSAP
jgi:diguanylate cyclase (GGDEF)-like protein